MTETINIAQFVNKENSTISNGLKNILNQKLPAATINSLTFSNPSQFQNAEADFKIFVPGMDDLLKDKIDFSQSIVVKSNNRNIIIFNPDIEKTISQNNLLKVGINNSIHPQLLINFLQKALPNKEGSLPEIETVLTNVTIDSFAKTGLDAMVIEAEEHNIEALLRKHHSMLLPQDECPAIPLNNYFIITAKADWAFEILKQHENRIGENCFFSIVKFFKNNFDQNQCPIGFAQYGLENCEEVFFSILVDNHQAMLTHWHPLPMLNFENKSLFSATDFMGRFFEYEYDEKPHPPTKDIVYIANYKAITDATLISGKSVWASGSRTWFELAKQGIWVQGSAEAFGLAYLETIWKKMGSYFSKSTMQIITNKKSALQWRQKGWDVMGTYEVILNINPDFAEKISNADCIFWSSIEQYHLYKSFCKQNLLHLCAYGETANQLTAAEENVIVFPGIKSFQQWKQTTTRLRKGE